MTDMMRRRGRRVHRPTKREGVNRRSRARGTTNDLHDAGSSATRPSCAPCLDRPSTSAQPGKNETGGQPPRHPCS